LKNKSERISYVSKEVMLSPGPGAYDANINAVKDKVRNVGFGKTQRSGFVGKDDKLKPGPGNYDIPDTKNKQAYKIGTRINNAMRDNTPGPGNYDPNVNVVKDSTRMVKIS
jgi:hypothetical protein